MHSNLIHNTRMPMHKQIIMSDYIFLQLKGSMYIANSIASKKYHGHMPTVVPRPLRATATAAQTTASETW